MFLKLLRAIRNFPPIFLRDPILRSVNRLSTLILTRTSGLSRSNVLLRCIIFLRSNATDIISRRDILSVVSSRYKVRNPCFKVKRHQFWISRLIFKSRKMSRNCTRRKPRHCWSVYRPIKRNVRTHRRCAGAKLFAIGFPTSKVRLRKRSTTRCNL